MNFTGLGEAAAVFTALTWAFSSLINGYTGARVGVSTLCILRFPIQLAMLALLCFFSGAGFSAVNAEILLYLFVSAMFGITLGDLTFYKSIVILGPRLGILFLTLSAGMTALLGFLFLNEPMTLRIISGIALTTLGVAFVISDREEPVLPGQSPPSRLTFLFGLFCGFTCALFLSISLLFLTYAMRQGVEAVSASFLRILMGGAVLLATGACAGWTRKAVSCGMEDKKIPLILAFSSVFSIAGIWASSLAVQLTAAGTAATLMSLQPVMVTILVALKERRLPSLKVTTGILLAFTGTALVSLR